MQAVAAELTALDSQLAVLERTLKVAQDWTHALGSLTAVVPHPARAPEGPGGP